MKLGDLASILEKDAVELGKAYEITETETDLDLETVSKILNPEITQLKKSLRIAAKDEGYKMYYAKRSNIQYQIHLYHHQYYKNHRRYKD